MLLCGCDHGKRRTEPQPPAPKVSFVALDREHQRLVRDYEPVSAALTGYELAYRDWRLGRLTTKQLRGRQDAYTTVVSHALKKLHLDHATGDTARAKGLLGLALLDRMRALLAAPGSAAYRSNWNRSLARARAGLSKLQDIRDRAKLIPLPEDSVS